MNDDFIKDYEIVAIIKFVKNEIGKELNDTELDIIGKTLRGFQEVLKLRTKN